jgi:hypothetical protein
MRNFGPLLLPSLLALAAGGCSGEGSESFESQTLTRVSEAGADQQCARGGVVIESGIDDNRNGVLDDDEVTAEETRVVCSGDSIRTGDELRRVDALPEGDSTCPEGGVAIHTGIDDNENATLEDAEIDETDIVCNSERPHPVLTRTSSVPVGSPDCRYGGRKVEAGIDDGAGDGTADDGALADGEVDTAYFDCNATPPDPVDVIVPPDGEPGTAVIDLRGGSAATGQSGGYGGTLLAEKGDGTQCVPEITRLFPTGTVDASFEVPEVPVDLGPVPMEVTATGTLKESTDGLVDGDFYYDAGSSVIRRYMAPGPGPVVTGMRVAANVTFVLPNGSFITLANDLEVLGTLKNSANEVRSLSLRARNVVVAPSGRIEVLQEQQFGSLDLQASGVLAMQGKLAVQGETPGAAGGSVSLDSAGRMFLAGSIDASGADSTSLGGAGGTVTALAGTGGVWSSAAIDASGGAGALQGGAGGSITLGGFSRSNSTLDVRNTGALDVHGGAQTACSDALCFGGTGGSIQLLSRGAALRTTGALTADGGDSEESGGGGGTIRLAVLPGRDDIRPPNLALSVSGELSATGGAGTTTRGNGGRGGTLGFLHCGGSGSSADFLGYESVQLGGGAADPTGGVSGRSIGGGGGLFDLVVDQSSEKARRLYVHVPLEARGGAGYEAGEGGFMLVDLSTLAPAAALPAGIPSLVLAGTHHFDGGASGQSGGGQGGSVSLRALGSIHVDGSISASSISSESDADPGSGQLEVVSLLGAVAIDAELRADGAEGLMYSGGSAGCIALEGRTLSFSGSASAVGGDASAGDFEGGSGGSIGYSSHDAAPEVEATLEVGGGSGMPAGASGTAGADLPSCFSFRVHGGSSPT